MMIPVTLLLITVADHMIQYSEVLNCLIKKCYLHLHLYILDH